jgi:hypothetical protein
MKLTTKGDKSHKSMIISPSSKARALIFCGSEIN